MYLEPEAKCLALWKLLIYIIHYNQDNYDNECVNEKEFLCYIFFVLKLLLSRHFFPGTLASDFLCQVSSLIHRVYDNRKEHIFGGQTDQIEISVPHRVYRFSK